MKQKLLIALVLITTSLSSFATDSLRQRINGYVFYSNFSKYKLNTLLASQGIPEIRTNRFGTGVGYELEFKKWLLGGGFSYSWGKYKEEDITTKSNLTTGELQLGYNILRKSNIDLFAGVAGTVTSNTVSIFQEPKPTISLDNLLGASNNLTIKNEFFSAGVFAKAYLFPHSYFAPYVSMGYYLPIAKAKWKAEETEIVNNVDENPFVFNVSVGFSLWDF